MADCGLLRAVRCESALLCRSQNRAQRAAGQAAAAWFGPTYLRSQRGSGGHPAGI